MKHSQEWHEQLILQLITIAVIGNGIVIIASLLLGQLRLHGLHVFEDAFISLPLISGLTLIYLGMLLRRRKRAAWAVVVPVYSFILTFNTINYLNFNGQHHAGVLLRNILLPLAVVSVLIYFRHVFTVKSAIQSFSISVRAIIVILAVILAYGTAGYMLLDVRDFHQEITIPEAFHRTIDQFDLTTTNELTAYTRRGAVFIDSLNILSAAAMAYVFVSLLGPVRAKFSNQSANRQLALELLEKYCDDSEDYFKIWPPDKSYFGTDDHLPASAMIAYHVQRGVALCVGEPIGRPTTHQHILHDFTEFCRLNDWLPAITHIRDESRQVYEDQGFELQKYGEEAVLEIDGFLNQTANNKYFRQIRNKFAKQGYSWELLQPPHNQALIARLQEISTDWLQLPGRQERSFMMGYFSDAYMQQSKLIVARDAAGTIQAFLNQIPTYQNREANYDLLRHTKRALGNVNDFILMAFIESAGQQGYKTVNLGLCPLSGLDKQLEEKSVIDSTLRFVYANGNRFYSFSGLHRFKAKYEPSWRSRSIAYKGGIRGFTRSMYALNKAMDRVGK